MNMDQKTPAWQSSHQHNLSQLIVYVTSILAMCMSSMSWAIPVCIAPNSSFGKQLNTIQSSDTVNPSNVTNPTDLTSSVTTPKLQLNHDPRDQAIGQRFKISIAGKVLTPDANTTQCTEINQHKIMVKISANDRPKTSFVLHQRDFPKGACIWYGNWYDSWSAWRLDEARHHCPK